MLDVFMAAQSSKDGGKGGSVLRQASRRLADKNDPHSTSTTQSASMSRLSVNMKPPHSASGSTAPSHEPSPQPQNVASSSNGSHAPATLGPATFSVCFHFNSCSKKKSSMLYAICFARLLFYFMLIIKKSFIIFTMDYVN